MNFKDYLNEDIKFLSTHKDEFGKNHINILVKFSNGDKWEYQFSATLPIINKAETMIKQNQGLKVYNYLKKNTKLESEKKIDK